MYAKFPIPSCHPSTPHHTYNNALKVYAVLAIFQSNYRFLATELVAPDANNLQPLVVEGLVQLLQGWVLWSQRAVGRDVHNERPRLVRSGSHLSRRIEWSHQPDRSVDRSTIPIIMNQPEPINRSPDPPSTDLPHDVPEAARLPLVRQQDRAEIGGLGGRQRQRASLLAAAAGGGRGQEAAPKGQRGALCVVCRCRLELVCV